MDVTVPEAGDNGLAGAVDDLRALRDLHLAAAADRSDHTIRRDEHRIGNRCGVGRRVGAAAHEGECFSLGRRTEAGSFAQKKAEQRGAEQMASHMRSFVFDGSPVPRQTEAIDKYFKHYKKELEDRLRLIHEGFQALKSEGFSVDSIAPQAAIYLTIQIDLAGRKAPGEKILEKQKDVTEYILNEAKLAVVPFYAFGAERSSAWYRLSVGTCKKEEISEMIGKLREALVKLK